MMENQLSSCCDQSETEPAARGRQEVASSKILIIDDEPIMVDVVSSHLNEAGFQNVVGTSEPIDAVLVMKRENPALVLLDISMPEVSGNYLIRVARADPLLKNTPVLVLTADDSEETRERAMSLGADDVLTKPLDPSDLVSRVEGALNRKLTEMDSSVRERRARTKPAMDTYHQLRNLAGRVDS